MRGVTTHGRAWAHARANAAMACASSFTSGAISAAASRQHRALLDGKLQESMDRVPRQGHPRRSEPLRRHRVRPRRKPRLVEAVHQPAPAVHVGVGEAHAVDARMAGHRSDPVDRLHVEAEALDVDPCGDEWVAHGGLERNRFRLNQSELRISL
jgi:hypothetical protein